MFGLGLLQNGNVRVRIFPERKEILVRGSCFSLISRQCVDPAQLQMRQCAYGIQSHKPSMIENLLKLGGSSSALSAATYAYDAAAGVAFPFLREGE